MENFHKILLFVGLFATLFLGMAFMLQNPFEYSVFLERVGNTAILVMCACAALWLITAIYNEFFTLKK